MEFFKKMFKLLILLVSFTVIGISPLVYASGPMEDAAIKNVQRKEVLNEEERQRISTAAGLLADYEIAAKKLVYSLDEDGINATKINEQANNLLNLSENIIDKTHFRLPQCKEYLAKTLTLKNNLKEISHDTLEKDYHHDGALPKAPVECYHTKDLFVHPATVLVLTRDDPALSPETKTSISSEITEVIGHTEVVRELVIY